MIRVSRTLEMHIRIEAIPHAPGVATLEAHVRLEAIPRATRVVYSRDTRPL